MRKNFFINVVASGFGSGYCPVAPGTAGTLVAIPIAYIFSFFNPIVHLISILALFFLGSYAAGIFDQASESQDNKIIVIDEIVGFLITMFLIKWSFASVIIGFILFRFFDISKIPPARQIDRKFKGGYGVVLDDVVAGIYANILLRIVLIFF